MHVYICYKTVDVINNVINHNLPSPEENESTEKDRNKIRKRFYT